jgi:hypothetical protein
MASLAWRDMAIIIKCAHSYAVFIQITVIIM